MTLLITIARHAYYTALLHHMQRRDPTHPDLPEVVVHIRELEDQLSTNR
jgi:hypothetical protein